MGDDGVWNGLREVVGLNSFSSELFLMWLRLANRLSPCQQLNIVVSTFFFKNFWLCWINPLEKFLLCVYHVIQVIKYEVLFGFYLSIFSSLKSNVRLISLACNDSIIFQSTLFIIDGI